jgi:excisionase family DNA binding protein
MQNTKLLSKMLKIAFVSTFLIPFSFGTKVMPMLDDGHRKDADSGRPQTALVGIGEAARLLGVSRTTMQKMVDSEMLEAVRTAGGHRRILRQSLNRHLRDRQTLQGLPPADPQRLRVLLVDPDPSAYRLLTEHLEAWALPVELLRAVDAVEALLQIERHRPQVVLTEVDIQPFGGLQLVNVLESQPGYRVPWALVFTARDPESVTAPPAHLASSASTITAPVIGKRRPWDRLRGFLEACVQRELRATLPLNPTNPVNSANLSSGDATAAAAHPADARWARGADSASNALAAAS